jgi:cytochrome P450
MTNEIRPDLPVFPMRRKCPFEPPEEYGLMREEGPVSRIAFSSGRILWGVTGHAQMRTVLTDPRFSANKTNPEYPNPAPGFHATVQQMAKAFGVMDAPEHTTHRRMLIDEFTVRRLKALRPRIQQMVDEALARLLASSRPADLVELFCQPVSASVICELLGVPVTDQEFFNSVTIPMASRSFSKERKIAASIELRDYLDKLVLKSEKEPGDDLLGRLILKYRNSGDYDHERITANLMMLLVAGLESTANMISLGAVALLEHPDELAEFKSGSVDALQAVDELLRYLSVADGGTARLALADVEIGGVTIQQGEGVVALAMGANHDPAVFEHPEELDLDRRNAREHLAFGHGAHQCLGQNLARMEVEIALKTLFAGIPGLRLAVPFESLPYKDDGQVYGIDEVPVEW